MSLKPIRNEQDYQKAKHLNYILLNDEPSSTRDDMLKVNAVLIKNYLERKISQTCADPIKAIELYSHQKGYSKEALHKILGNDIDAVLNKEKPLTTMMIWQLCRQWKIPANLLIQDYSLRPHSDSSMSSQSPSSLKGAEQ